MAFDFPDGASNGDTHTASNGVVYRFDGTVWVVDRPSNTASFDAKYLNTTGDGIVSSSAQISTQIFTAVTSSGDISSSADLIGNQLVIGGGTFTSASLAAGGVTSYSDLTNVPVGIISGSGQLPSGTISGSGQLPSGVISGSGQLPSGVISGSLQLPSGIISGSQQLPSGIISGSLQLPSGLISGSTQISESGFVSSSTTNIIEVMTSASYASITPVDGTLYIIQG